MGFNRPIWLKCVVPKLGFRRVISTLDKKLDTDPVAVDKALYWLPRLMPKGDMTSAQALRELQDVFARRKDDAERLAHSIKTVVETKTVAVHPLGKRAGRRNAEIKF